MEDIVKKFYEDIVNSSDFNGNYFDAMINAIAMAKGYNFLKSMFRSSYDAERENY